MENSKNLTIDDIARELGVSKTTVSRAISGKGRISEATRQRVLEYIQAHHYHPNAAAKSLAESRTYNIALVLPKAFIKLNQTHVRQSMSAICEEAFLQDYNILLCLSTDDATPSLLRTIDNRKVDGVILARTVANDPVVELLSNRGIPFATIGSLSPADQGKAVVEADHDQIGGCRAFSKAFFQSGSGKMAVLGNDMDYIVNQSRLTGFRQAVQELHIPENMIELRAGMDNRPKRYAVVDELLELGYRRFLCMDEEVCLDAMERLHQLGCRIPEDVTIACLYDSEQLANATPPVSALEFNAAEIGRVACRELLMYLKGEHYDPKPMLGYRIIKRTSA
jgi:DNA-binding LacI/PurR family transcriptional regulator